MTKLQTTLQQGSGLSYAEHSARSLSGTSSGNCPRTHTDYSSTGATYTQTQPNTEWDVAMSCHLDTGSVAGLAAGETPQLWVPPGRSEVSGMLFSHLQVLHTASAKHLLLL